MMKVDEAAKSNERRGADTTATVVAPAMALLVTDAIGVHLARVVPVPVCQALHRSLSSYCN